MSKALNENMLGKVSGGKYELVNSEEGSPFGKGTNGAVKQTITDEKGREIPICYKNDAKGNAEREYFANIVNEKGGSAYTGKDDTLTG